MSAKQSLTLEDYRAKVQEEADKIASEKNESKIEVIVFPKSEQGSRSFGCARKGTKLCLIILNEALARVNEKYELGAEDEAL